MRISDWSSDVCSSDLFAAFLLTVFSALRLARFNVDERQKTRFMGLPTPACGLFFASFALAACRFPQIDQLTAHPFILLPMVLIMTYLLFPSLPLPSLHFIRDDTRGHRFRLFFMSLA